MSLPYWPPANIGALYAQIRRYNQLANQHDPR